MAMPHEGLHAELQELRASIRQDMREELSYALAGFQAGSHVVRPLRVTNIESPTDEPVRLPGCLSREDERGPSLSLPQTDRSASPSLSLSQADRPSSTCQRKSDGERVSGDWLSPSPLNQSTTTSMTSGQGIITRVSAASYTSSEPPGRVPIKHNKNLRAQRTGLDESLRHTMVARVTEQSVTRPSYVDRISSAISHSKHLLRLTFGPRTSSRFVSLDEVLELVAAGAIIANGVLMGVQTEVMAQKRTDDAPMDFFYAEVAFCLVFTIELALRMAMQRKDFCSGSYWYWNVFDVFLVLLQMVDVTMETIGNLSSGGATLQLSFLRLLRILRILRVMRLLRLLKFFGELNVVTSAIANSIKSLYGTVLMLLLMIYMFAIAFTGAANSKLIEMKGMGLDIDDTPLGVWWSSLGRTVLSLYESILGGVDWDDLIIGLQEVNFFWALLFLCYISFMILTMLNVITGIFVDSAVKHAVRFHEKSFTENMRRLFNLGDAKHKGTVTREEFYQHWTSPQFHAIMREVGIEPLEVRLLFDILDSDKSEDIAVEEFLAGMLRLRASAKFIDIMNLQRLIEQRFDTVTQQEDS